MPGPTARGHSPHTEIRASPPRLASDARGVVWAPVARVISSRGTSGGLAAALLAVVSRGAWGWGGEGLRNSGVGGGGKGGARP